MWLHMDSIIFTKDQPTLKPQFRGEIYANSLAENSLLSKNGFPSIKSFSTAVYIPKTSVLLLLLTGI